MNLILYGAVADDIAAVVTGFELDHHNSVCCYATDKLKINITSTCITRNDQYKRADIGVYRKQYYTF